MKKVREKGKKELTTGVESGIVIERSREGRIREAGSGGSREKAEKKVLTNLEWRAKI